MFMYINNFKVIYTHHLFFLNTFYVTSLIIYATKPLPIYHHVVKNSAQGEKAYFEISYVILRRSQIRVCTPFPYKKYILYIVVYCILG